MSESRTRPLRVLVVTHTARLGGAELALLRLCRALDPTTAVIRVACFEDGPLVQLFRKEGVPVDILRSGGSWSTQERTSTGQLRGLARVTTGAVGQAARVARHIKEVRPDVVQSWTLKAHLVTTLGLPFHARPLVWFLHDRVTGDYLGPLNRRVLETLSRIPRAVIANSRATASTLPRACAVAYPGLTESQFRPVEVTRDRTRDSPPTVLLLGRISPTKGQREAIVALSTVREHHPDVRLRIVGSAMFGEQGYEAECRQLVGDLGLSDAVEFAGYSPDPQVDLDQASMLLHASPVPEPFGQVIAEAMARGVPVVATDAGGVPELMIDSGEECGLLVPPGDPAAIADAVHATLSDPAAAADRAARAYRAADERFRISTTVDVVTRVWRTVGGGDL